MRLDLSTPVTVSYNQCVYTSFPDVIRTSGGDLICVFRESDTHHPTMSTLVLSRSTDEGQSWNRLQFAESNLKEDGYVFNCPRINNVGKDFVIICDTKSSQKEATCKWTTLAWQSSDSRKWNDPRDLGIAGMVPDKILSYKRMLVMGYHIVEKIPNEDRNRLIPMMAISC